MAVFAERSAPVNQGDIFLGIPFQIDPPGPGCMGMVISHDCEVDKFMAPARPLTDTAREAWTFTVALVHPVDELGASRAGSVRADAMPRYFYLEADPDRPDLPELCVDLWTEQPVRALELVECERIASLSPASRLALWWKIIRLRLGEHYKSILTGDVPDDAA